MAFSEKPNFINATILYTNHATFHEYMIWNIKKNDPYDNFQNTSFEESGKPETVLPVLQIKRKTISRSWFLNQQKLYTETKYLETDNENLRHAKMFK